METLGDSEIWRHIHAISGRQQSNKARQPLFIMIDKTGVPLPSIRLVEGMDQRESISRSLTLTLTLNLT